MDVDGSLRDTWIRETNEETALNLLQQCSAGVFFSLLVFIVRLLHLTPAEILITSACSSVFYWKCIFRILQGKIRHPPIKKESNIFMDFFCFWFVLSGVFDIKISQNAIDYFCYFIWNHIYWRISYSKLTHLSFYIYISGNSVRWKDQSCSKFWTVTMQRQ